MLRQYIRDADACADYLEHYFDFIENVPADIQRYFTHIREIDIRFQNSVSDIVQTFSTLYGSPNDVTAESSLSADVSSRLHAALTGLHEVYEDKMHAIQSIRECIMRKHSQLDLCFKLISPNEPQQTVDASNNHSESVTHTACSQCYNASTCMHHTGDADHCMAAGTLRRHSGVIATHSCNGHEHTSPDIPYSSSTSSRNCTKCRTLWSGASRQGGGVVSSASLCADCAPPTTATSTMSLRRGAHNCADLARTCISATPSAANFPSPGGASVRGTSATSGGRGAQQHQRSVRSSRQGAQRGGSAGTTDSVSEAGARDCMEEVSLATRSVRRDNARESNAPFSTTTLRHSATRRRKRRARKETQKSHTSLHAGNSGATPQPATATSATGRVTSSGQQPTTASHAAASCNTSSNSSSGALSTTHSDPGEPTYCLCEQVFFGEMIGCDNDLCPIEWFHFACVNIVHKPKGKWFCPRCRGERTNVMKPRHVFLRELQQYNQERSLSVEAVVAQSQPPQPPRSSRRGANSSGV